MASHMTIYCLDQECMQVFIISEKLEVLSELVNPIDVNNQTFIMKHRPVAQGCMGSHKNFSSYVYMYQSRP